MENTTHPRILNRGRVVMQVWDVMRGQQAAWRLARQEVAVIPNCRAREKKALPEARGEP